MAFFKYADKNVYYEEAGSGQPLFLLHGNSVSSKMFGGVADLYKNDFNVILVDFLGHGNSDRLKEFPVDFWYDEAMQIIELILLKGYEKVNLIGTSGGALAALNVALEREDLVDKVIADSFEGESVLSSWADTVREERGQAKTLEQMRLLWEYCHGSDWESVVDNDTDVIIRHEKSVKRFFHKDLAKLNVPVLLTASMEDDEFAGRMDIERTFRDMADKIPGAKLHLFPSGGHPAMLTNAEEFSELAKEFFGV
ncbi:alpha/beta hydrolase [[Clostridium] symbiosum]|uniref:alpha/beta fold hydrolase n=1 Tax=Clostridium symbiosum TaxID=1512 RepID=UPI001D07D7BE|nr:alpha/beta hydrolase [[Clostridium] symbiosum]MCB6610620.1 alpha/beta hydrolase [[Clostridium] symbiosum]MCB6930934.1 alpha/beta hydrolase [[Clostridium] symbiosum]